MILFRQRILVVEDEALIALDIVDGIEDAGGTALGPADSLRSAFLILDAETVTAAVLDVNLRDGEVTPFAQALIDRAIPFVIQTGGGVPARLRSCFGDAPILHKPNHTRALIDTLAGTIAARARLRQESRAA